MKRLFLTLLNLGLVLPLLAQVPIKQVNIQGMDNSLTVSAEYVDNGCVIDFYIPKEAYVFRIEAEEVIISDDGMGMNKIGNVYNPALFILSQDSLTIQGSMLGGGGRPIFYELLNLAPGTYLVKLDNSSKFVSFSKVTDVNALTSQFNIWQTNKEAQQSFTKQNKNDKYAEKYIPLSLLKNIKGLYPKEVVTNKVVYPDGSSVNSREGLLFQGKDGSNFMIALSYTIEYPLKQPLAGYSFKSHPDLGNIIVVGVSLETEVATIVTKNGKVVDYKVIGKLKPDMYAIPLYDNGCAKDFLSVNLTNEQTDYWYFQLEDCTLSPAIIKESQTVLKYK